MVQYFIKEAVNHPYNQTRTRGDTLLRDEETLSHAMIGMECDKTSNKCHLTIIL